MNILRPDVVWGRRLVNNRRLLFLCPDKWALYATVEQLLRTVLSPEMSTQQNQSRFIRNFKENYVNGDIPLYAGFFCYVVNVLQYHTPNPYKIAFSSFTIRVRISCSSVLQSKSRRWISESAVEAELVDEYEAWKEANPNA